MISIRKLKRRKKIRGFLNTKEKVHQARINLEEATKESLRESRISRLRSWSKSSFIVLD